MSGLTFPTGLEADRMRYNEDRSLDYVCRGMGAGVVSPLSLLVASVVGILFAANVIPSEIAVAVGGACGGAGVLFSPFTIASLYGLYRYRKKPLSAEDFKCKLLSALHRPEIEKNRPEIEKTKIFSIANEYNIQLST